MQHKGIYYSCIIGLIFLFITTVLIIFKGHTDIGFWYQSDNSWAPAFAQDVLVKHHAIRDWHFSGGTTQLMSIVPYALFSLFTHQLPVWMLANAWLLLTGYFLLFFGLGRVLFDDWHVSLLIPLSCLISLALLACFKQIPFTLDSLLVSNEHEYLLLMTLLGLLLVLYKLKWPNNYWCLPLLFLIVCVQVVSDEIFILSFVMPALVALFFYLNADKNKNLLCCVNAIVIILIATGVGRIMYYDLPLEYARTGATLALKHTIIEWPMINPVTRELFYRPIPYHFLDLVQTVGYYIKCMWQHYTVYLLATLAFFPICISVLRFKKIYSFALIFILMEWLTGVLRFFISRHAQALFITHLLGVTTLENFCIHGLTVDANDFFVIPLFLGFPVLMGYACVSLGEARRKVIFNSLNSVCIVIIVALLGHAWITARHAVPYSTQKKQALQLMNCLETQVQKNHLHAGIASYWIYRPVKLLSNNQIQVSSLSSDIGTVYEHYLSSWDEIHNKNIDFWVARYDRFFKDPDYANYYNADLEVSDKLHHFGKPDGEFTCHAADGTWLHVYFYKHNQLMQKLLPSIREEGKPRAYINRQKRIDW